MEFINREQGILIPRGHAPFGQHQESQPPRRSNFLSMCREFILYSQPVKFVRLDSEHAQNDKKSVNRRLPHSRPQRLHSFWSAPRIATSGRVQFSEHVQRICFVFSANQICQTWLWACAKWQEVCESQTSGVRPSRFLVLTKRRTASGDENRLPVLGREWEQGRKWEILKESREHATRPFWEAITEINTTPFPWFYVTQLHWLDIVKFNNS